jgi:hypothetical protein
MKIKDYKCKCEHNDFFFADKGNQTGIYCSYCGKWLKWADKDEQNLRMKQVSVLDKIRAEIEQLRLHKAEFLTNDNKVCIDSQAVLNILDKYKAESEDKG